MNWIESVFGLSPDVRRVRREAQRTDMSRNFV